MTFQFRPGVRERVSLLIGLAGASGSGKTYSALQLATGLAGAKGKIAVIDTEAGRALHYADQFKFDHGDLSAPFRPERYQEAILAADKAGYDVIVIDSMSHEYEGEGGLIEWAAELERSGTKSPGNWKAPKTAHKRMMNRLLQMRAHLIFCMRADEKIKIDRVEGKTVVIPLGWMPICEKRFMYELTASFTLSPETPGRPRFDLPHKLQEQHRPAFPAGEPIGREAGATLAAWARGGAAPRPRPAVPPPADDAPDDAPPFDEPPEPDLGAIARKLAGWVEKCGDDDERLAKLAAWPKYREAYAALVAAKGHPLPDWPAPKGE